jgi:hypothetical protein
LVMVSGWVSAKLLVCCVCCVFSAYYTW